MSHVFFFSYASENYDKELKKFFEDLCGDVAPNTQWAANDPRISFRDGNNLPLMAEWRPAIMDALQTSAVMVCITSVAYFRKPFCGQEYWVFDQRRRQSVRAGKAPGVILPVIWAPVPGGLPAYIDEFQWSRDFPKSYHEKGLRYVQKSAPEVYEKIVLAFAEAIGDAHDTGAAIPALPAPPAFELIPNQFAGGQWEDAADARGWLPGPGVANFVFAAARDTELKTPPGRYGASEADWRPYLPPVPRTIADISVAAAKKHSLRYREIIINENIAVELQASRDRKNLTVVLADASSLALPRYCAVAPFDAQLWEGTAVLMPWNGPGTTWKDVAMHVSASFPIASQLKAPVFSAPVSTAEELDTLLDITLTDILAQLTRAETEKKPKTDAAPAQIVGSTGPAS